MVSIDPKDLPVQKLHQYLLGAIGPRPIAFASTVDAEGKPNLAPFSFFNVFSANPPILIFSPARSGRTNTTKDTYNNVHFTVSAPTSTTASPTTPTLQTRGHTFQNAPPISGPIQLPSYLRL